MLITMVHLILMFQPLTIALAVMISTVEERLNSWTDAPLNSRPGSMQ